MTNKKQSEELTDLLTKLYTIQEEVGAIPKTSKEEKKKKAENASQMGKGRNAKKTGSRFLELKSSIVERLQHIHQLLEEEADRASGRTSVAAGNNPKEIIAAQAEMREQIRQASEEWKELDGLYKKEARKRRSKFTQSELEVQETLVNQLQAEIEKVKEAQLKGYARGNREDVAASLNTAALASLDAADFTNGPSGEGGGGGNGWKGQAGGAALTNDQKLKLEQIDKRDADFDKQIDDIGEGIQDLHEIALQQGEEVKRQNVMLDNVGNKIEKVNEHVNSVNEKMKDTLDEVGRSADKLCVDIMCILLMVGFAAVFYNMFKNS